MSILKVGMYASQFPAKQNYLTFSSDAPFSISFTAKHWDGVLEHSPDAENWYEWDASEINSSGNVLYLRGTGNSYITGVTSSTYAMQITATDGVECSGNIMTLLDHVNPDNAVMSNGAFASLFWGQDKLITSPELPAMTLADNCYRNMLRDCTSLTTAPELPAMTLADNCYRAMLYNCTSLTAAPELPAMTLAAYCYYSMLYDCTNLTAAPELPAMTLAAYCYYSMLRGCTGIKISSTQEGIYQKLWRIPTTGTGTTATEWNTLMLSGTGGTFTSNPDINTTYYQAE